MTGWDLLAKGIESGSALLMLGAVLIMTMKQKTAQTAQAAVPEMCRADSQSAHLLELEKQLEATARAVESAALASRYEHEALKLNQVLIMKQNDEHKQTEAKT